MSRPRSQTCWALALTVALALGCATPPLSVRQVDPQAVHRRLTANVLSTGQPSIQTVWELNRRGLLGKLDVDLPGTLTALREELSENLDPGLLFALTELSFLAGERTGDRAHYLATVVYAVSYVARAPKEGMLAVIDARAQLAAALYGRALAEAFKRTDDKYLVFPDGATPLPFGTLEIEVDPKGFTWGGNRLVQFESAAELDVRGIRNRYRTAGYGAALVASVEPIPGTKADINARRVLPRVKVPVTALLRIDDADRVAREGSGKAVLEIYAVDESELADLGDVAIPLEIEWTSALAYTLAASRFTDFELLGFRGGDLMRALDLKSYPDGLLMLHPHRPGRVPIVLVHGTASSPARWADMVNELMSDPEIRKHCEFWLYTYNSGDLIASSGLDLRNALQSAVRDLDPEGVDPALQRMVLVGHSQGGLVSKLTAVKSGDQFWRTLSDEPFEQAKLSKAARDLLGRSLFVEPLPSVKRVIYIATPHRGSFLATWRISGLTRWLIQTPGRWASIAPDILKLATPKGRAEFQLRGLPSSVDNMTPGNPFLDTLADLPLAPGVASHSIIPVEGGEPYEDLDDGVVSYRSAHVAGVESEKVIQYCNHSTQSHPATILEVRRILREHLAQ